MFTTKIWIHSTFDVYITGLASVWDQLYHLFWLYKQLMDSEKTWQPSWQGYCGHVLTGLLSLLNYGFRKAASLFCKENRNQSLQWVCTVLITLWSVLFFLKVRWSSEQWEHYFISAFVPLRRLKQRNHPVPLVSSSLWDPLHMEIDFLLELCMQTSRAFRWLLPVSAK